MVDIKIAN